MNCELCNFNNPKASATAVIIQNNKLLLLKRNEEPYKGTWDLPGGYLDGQESPQDAIRREMREELGVYVKEETFIKTVSGSGKWGNKVFPVISFFYLVDIGDQKIKLNKENSKLKWIAIKDLHSEDIAWDTNKEIVKYIKQKFGFDIKKVKKLIKQLDNSATFNEQTLYKAQLDGQLILQETYEGKALGMGWMFIRQTMLRKQGVIEDMIVDNKQRGRGIGRAILKELIHKARQQGVDTLELTTGYHRKAAYELYKSEGFKFHKTRHMLKKL